MAAGFTTSLKVNAQAILAEKYQKPEFKHEPYKLIRLMLERGKSPFTDKQLDAIYTSDSMTVESFAFAKRAADVATARAHDHTLADFGESPKVTLSVAINAYKYGVSLKMGGRNVLDQAQMLAKDLESQAIAGNNVLEAAIAAYVATYPTQVNAASGSWAKFGAFNGAGDYTWVIPAAEEKWVFDYIREIMSINDYDVPLDIICDNQGWALRNQLATQGQGNDTNTGWQFDGMNIVKSYRVVDSNYAATFYVMPQGSVGMVSRIPSENRRGVSTRLYDYSKMTDPLGTGLELATHAYETGSTTALKGGETQDVTFEYENSHDYAFIKAPLSGGPTYSPIFKFALGN
jgi:hypothetical protein